MKKNEKRVITIGSLFMIGLLPLSGCTINSNDTMAANSQSSISHLSDNDRLGINFLNDIVKSNNKIRSAIFTIASGDGSFTLSQEVGTANDNGTPMTPETPIYLASITKLYTAVVVMRLYEMGLLDLGDSMAKYLPNDMISGIHVFEGHDYSKEITIAQLLAHTSGIADSYLDKSPQDGKSQYDLYKENQDKKWTIEEIIGWVRDKLPAHFAPNNHVAYYSDTNYMLLGKIIESVTGKELQDIYDEFLFEPLGLTHTWLVGKSKPKEEHTAAPAEIYDGDTNITKMRYNGACWADGGIISTTKEAIVFLKALNQGKIIKPSTLNLMHDWHPVQNSGPFTYGYGTMYFDGSLIGKNIPSPLWGHSGSLDSFLYYAKELDLYIAGTVNQKDAPKVPFMLMISAMNKLVAGGKFAP